MVKKKVTMIMVKRKVTMIMMMIMKVTMITDMEEAVLSLIWNL